MVAMKKIRETRSASATGSSSGNHAMPCPDHSEWSLGTEGASVLVSLRPPPRTGIDAVVDRRHPPGRKCPRMASWVNEGWHVRTMPARTSRYCPVLVGSAAGWGLHFGWLAGVRFVRAPGGEGVRAKWTSLPPAIQGH